MNATRHLISFNDRESDRWAGRPDRQTTLEDPIDAGLTSLRASEGATPLDFAELLRRLLRRRRLIVVTALVVTGLAVIGSNLLTPRYQATAQVMIDPRSARVTDIESVLPELKGDKETIQTEIEVIRSRRLAKLAIDKMDLLQYPTFNPTLEQESSPLQRLSEWVASLTKGSNEVAPSDEEIRQRAVEKFIGSLDVSPEGQSRVINITTEAETPELATVMANVLSSLYLEDQVRTKIEASERASDWLLDRLKQLQPEVEASERAVEEYRHQARLDKGQQSNVTVQQLSELNTQVVIAQAKRSEIEARLNQVATLIDQPDRIEAVPEVLASPVIQNILNQRAQLERKRAELSSEFGPNHPTMLTIQAEINGLQAGLSLQVKQIVASLKNELESAKFRMETLDGLLEETRQQAGGLKEKEVDLRALERTAKANRVLYEQMLKRQKETASEAERALEPDARLVSVADVPLRPSFPKKKMIVLAAFAGSLGLGVLLALLAEYLDRSLRSPEQISRLTGLRTLATVPLTKGLKTSGRFGRKTPSTALPFESIIHQPGSAFGEALRSLYTNLTVTGYRGYQVKVVLFTSSQAQEGKSTVALSLGQLLAVHGKKVIVVDADIRRPQVAARLNLRPSPGLVEVARNEYSLDDAIQYCPESGLHALPAGGPALSPQELFEAPSLRSQVFDNLAAMYDLVIVDSPPVLAVSDAQMLCRLVDQTVFVVRWSLTPSDTVLAGLQQLVESGADLAGIVLNQIDVAKSTYYGYADSAYYRKENIAYYSS